MTDLLYEKTKQQIAEQIKNKTYLQGDRLPSIRTLSKKLNVSIGTIQKAYAGLEDQGLITPRNRSGYYVTIRQPVAVSPPEAASFNSKPTRVRVLETAISVMRSASQKTWIQLGSAVPDIKGKGIIQLHREFKRQAHKIANYEEDPQGYLPLRRRLARRFLKNETPVHPDEIVITAGCQEALTIALRCIANPGDTIVVESPCYYGVLQALEIMELNAVEIPVSPTDGIDVDLLESIIIKWPVKGILLNPSFSNPSGYVCSEPKKQEIIKLISKYDLPLIEDDVFADLGFSGNRPRSIQSYDPDGRVILCSSISKTLCPDLRIGWMIAGRYAKKARTLKFISTLCAPCHPQFALAQFLTTHNFERHLRFVTAAYEKKQQRLLKAIKQRLPDETKATQPDGGFLTWLRLPDGIDGLTLYRHAIRKGITLTPGELCSPTGRYKSHIRLNYAVATSEQIDYAMKTLAALIHIQKNPAADEKTDFE